METAIAIRIHRRDDVERYRVFACMHSSTGWQAQEHKKQPSLFANDMVRAKHGEEMRCSKATTGTVELMEDGKRELVKRGLQHHGSCNGVFRRGASR